jgi:hypothetical protein
MNNGKQSKKTHKDCCDCSAIADRFMCLSACAAGLFIFLKSRTAKYAGKYFQ